MRAKCDLLAASAALFYSRKVWPLMTVETEANGNSWSTNERVPFLAGSLGLSFRYKRFLSCLGCSFQPNINFSPNTF
jgi:hypothetical protein